MTVHPLNYSPPEKKLSRRWAWRILIAMVLLVALAAGFLTTFSTQVSRMDPVTGSRMSRTIWPAGISSGSRITVSPLETKLRERGIKWTPSWQFVHESGHSIFGNTTYLGCGSLPPVANMQGFAIEFVRASSDADLRAFVQAMESGTEEQQKAAVDAAIEKSGVFPPRSK